MRTLLLTLLLVPMMSFGQNNYSMSFDGDDIINSITTNSILNDYSIAFNFKTDYVQPQPGNNDQIFRYWINNNIYEINIGGYINGVNYTGQVFAFPSGGTFDYSSGQTYNDGVWHTAVIIKNNSNNLLETYVDGTLSSTFTETPNVGTLEIEAGGDFAHHYEGNIDNLSIWSKTLSQQEIQQYINCPPNGSESDLVVYWNFEEGSGTTALDLTSNGNNGTINGATYSTDVPVQNCCTPNPIATQPADQSVNIGDDANISFTDNLTGASYQWQMDSGTGYTNISNAGQFSGSDSQTLTINSTTMNNNNTLYRCILTESSDCQDTTDVVTLTVVNNVGIGELNNTPKQLIKIVDVLGRETPFKPNTPLLYIYNDGTVERKMIIKE